MSEQTELSLEGTRVGVVTRFFGNISVAGVLAEETIKVGDTVRIYDKEGNAVVEQSIDSMQVDGGDVEEVEAGVEFGLKVEEDVKDGYLVYRQ